MDLTELNKYVMGVEERVKEIERQKAEQHLLCSYLKGQLATLQEENSTLVRLMEETESSVIRLGQRTEAALEVLERSLTEGLRNFEGDQVKIEKSCMKDPFSEERIKQEKWEKFHIFCPTELIHMLVKFITCQAFLAQWFDIRMRHR